MSRPTAGLDRATVAARVRAFPRRAADRPDLTQAAVAVCVTGHEASPALLLTRRAPRMRAHPGQWALPGGRREPGESAVDGALRELQEEVGLVVDRADVLGLLDDYVTRSGYVMTPVADLDVEPRFLTIPESDAPVIQLPLFGRFVHAPTAAVVHQFCQVACHGLATRVAHLEQPVFAWR